MGNCISSTEQTNDNYQPQRHHRHNKNNGRRGRSEMYIQSMARVGSRVYKQNSLDDNNDDNDGDRQTARTTLTEHKASTYNHVHQIVEQSIDDIYATNNRNSGDSSLSGKVGLRNLGNTCFMNSSLQCLSNTIPLTDYVLGYDYRGEINHDNILGTQGQLVTSYAELIKNLWLGSSSSCTPTTFKSILGQYAPQFEGYEQQDSQELLSYLLDGIHEDLNRVKNKPYIEDKDCDGTNDEGDAITAWSNYLQRNQSIIVDMFQGQLRSTMTCQKQQPDGTLGCGHRNIKFDPFMYLSLPISNECNTLNDCLDLFCEEEVLTGDEQWYCTKCKCLVDATKKIDLFMLPAILIVHLKRFKFSNSGHRSKIDTCIQYPLTDWNLSKQKKSIGGIYPLYDLYAISQHHGTVGGGHYTAHCKNRFDGRWYNFNDSQCHAIDSKKTQEDEQLGISSSAYCLFYNRVEKVAQTNGKCIEKKVVIRRQSIGRPELWPHLQREKISSWTSVRLNDFIWNDDVNSIDEDKKNDVDDDTAQNQQYTINEEEEAYEC